MDEFAKVIQEYNNPEWQALCHLREGHPYPNYVCPLCTRDEKIKILEKQSQRSAAQLLEN